MVEVHFGGVADYDQVLSVGRDRSMVGRNVDMKCSDYSVVGQMKDSNRLVVITIFLTANKCQRPDRIGFSG